MVHLLAHLAGRHRPLAVLAVLLAALPAASAAESRPRVLVADYAGIISPVAAEFVSGALERAEREGFDALVLRLDTPGGLDLSMRETVKDELAARVPVIVYVAPAGARAASAGVFITMAAHVAAMAPGTNIGAAHPVMIGRSLSSGSEKPDATMEEKIANDAAAYLRSIARERGRNESWAREAVTRSTSTPAEEAVRLGVVDLIAGDMDELLDKVDGREIPALKRRLRTKGAGLTHLEMTGRQKALAVLADPNVAMILMSIGAAGLFVELYNPGLIFPGIVGAISLLLAFYAFQTLSANIAGVLLMLLGFLLFLIEIKVMSYGLLTAGGLAALFFGALMLFNTPGTWGVSVSLSVVAWTAAVILAFTGTLALLYMRTRGRAPETGKEALVGAEGVATTALAPDGTVRVLGELWNARSEEGAIAAGESVEVTGVKGLMLRVRRRAKS